MPYNGSGSLITALRLIYLREYFNAIGKSQRNAITLQDIKDMYLDKLGVGVSTNTVYNDINTLMSAFGMEIRYISRHGYILENPTFENYELRLIIDSLQSSKFITQKEADKISRKIKDNFTNNQTRASLNRQAFVADRVRSMNDSVVKDADNIHAAIESNRKISFRYFHRKANRDKSRKYSKNGEMLTVSPFALFWENGNYYLYAYLSESKKFRTFRVDRMDKISEPLWEERDGSKEYRSADITNQKAVVFDAFKTNKVYNVEFRCLDRIADSIIDKFGENTWLREEDEHHFTFSAMVDVSPPFYAWVSTFGRMIKITAPDEVVCGMRDYLNKSLDMYKD